MKNAITVKNLNKNYKNFSLKDVSFEVPSGLVVGFIGTNGSGKTTTIRSLLGLSTDFKGEISFFDKKFKGNEKEIKQKIGVVFDEGCFYDHFTLDEMKGVIAPSYKNWNEDKYKELCSTLSLERSKKIADLSKGMRMKFSLALALSHEADLLIMDEPTSGLDPLVRSQILDILSDYMKNGEKSILFSTHITSDLDKIADSLVLINDGEIIFCKDKDELIESHRLVKGDTKYLTENLKSKLKKCDITSYGFSGITNDFSEFKRNVPNVILEKPTIDDIMLCYATNN